MNTNSSRDDSFQSSNKILFDMPNDYDEDEEEEDLSLFKTAIYTKETPKDALITKTASNFLQISDSNDSSVFLSPHSIPNSTQNSNHTSNNSINSCKYNSSNNSIQSISSSSPLVTTSSPSADTPTSNLFVIPTVKIIDEDQDSFCENSLCRKNDNITNNNSNNINHNNHSKKKIDNSKNTKNACKQFLNIYTNLFSFTKVKTFFLIMTLIHVILTRLIVLILIFFFFIFIYHFISLLFFFLLFYF